MKKFYLLILMLCCSIGLFAQAKSIEVDCQTPGWLSSKINYGDQLTVENLTVTGYINGTDIKFIRELNKNRKLKGVLNLEYANIVIGGEAYYTYSGSKYTTKDNILTDFIFANLDSLQKVVLPKTLNQLEGGHQFMGTYVDTLIINGELEDIYIGYSYDSNFWKTRCVYIPEGVKNIDFGYLFRDLPNKEFFLPSTLETVNGLTAALSERNITFHCSSTNPENIKVVSYTNNNYSFFDGGTIYVPEGTAEKYKNSIFRKLTIIEDVAVNNIKFEEDSIIAYVGDNGLLNTNVYPSNAIHKEILYSSSNEDILKITESGEYTCIKFGEVLVYAFSYNKEFSDTCKVKVYEHTTGVDIEPNVTIRIGETIIIDAQTAPLGKSDNKLTYVSSDENIATVDEKGTIFGIKQGECRITAISIDGGYTAECTVNVIQPVEEIELSEHSIEIKKGDFKQLYSKILPSNANNKNVLWYSTDSLIASVNEQGMVEGLKSGNAYIKAMSIDNPTLMDSCYVTVLQPVEGISLNISEHTFKEIGESIQLTANVLPEDATNKEVKWKSFNESICVVSNGKVFAVGFGTTVITATTIDGGFVDICSITVEDTTDIELIEADKGDYKIYDINGNQLQHFKIGVNIIKFKDGKVVKIVK